MKYKTGQSVILLDTEFKPAAPATIKEVNVEIRKYLITYTVHNQKEDNELWVPQERLSTLLDALTNHKG